MAWRVAKSLLTLRDQINAMAPGRSTSSDGTIGDAAHQATNSDHNPNADGVVTAMDITHDPSHGVDAGKLAEMLRVSRDQRIKYVISQRRIFSSKVSPWQWRPYTGVSPHTEHVHISVDADRSLYDDTRPWAVDGLMKPGEVPREAAPGRNTRITATVFGGRADPNNSFYDNKPITDEELGVALPYRFPGTLPLVRVINMPRGAYPCRSSRTRRDGAVPIECLSATEVSAFSREDMLKPSPMSATDVFNRV